MPNQHKSTKRGMSFRAEPEVLDNLKALAAFNGVDVTGLMVKLSKGLPVKYPDGTSVYSTSPEKEK